MPEIRLEDVVKTFEGGVVAVNHLDLNVKDGEYMCLLGPTGAGKTTVLKMICGLVCPDSGKVLLDGKNISNIPISRRGTALMSQNYALFPKMTVYENVMFSPSIKNWDPADAKTLVRSMIEMVHMGPKVDNMPHEMSGGQMQRTALARALASNSRVLLLDEPLRALDARLRLEIRKEIKSMVKDMDLTSVHVTHDQEEAMEIADRIAVIRKGRIIQVGTPMDIFCNPKTPFVANFVGRSNVFTGKLVSSSEESSEILLDSGHKVLARSTDLSPGTDVAVAVKIGYVISKIHKEGESLPEWYMEGTVSRVLYEGGTITIELDVKGLGIVTCRRSSKRYDDYKKGKKVSVIWVPSKAVVFSIPECGLEEELRLD